MAGGLGVGIPIGSTELLLLGGYSNAFGVFDDIGYLILTVATRIPIG